MVVVILAHKSGVVVALVYVFILVLVLSVVEGASVIADVKVLDVVVTVLSTEGVVVSPTAAVVVVRSGIAVFLSFLTTTTVMAVMMPITTRPTNTCAMRCFVDTGFDGFAVLSAISTESDIFP